MPKTIGKEGGDTIVSFRVNDEVVDRAEALIAKVKRDPYMVASGVTRSAVLRLALAHGLDHLENKYG